MKLEDYIHNEQIEWFVERTSRHIAAVRKFCCFAYLYDPARFEGILQRAVFHDATKYSDKEILAYTVLSWKYKMESEGQTIDFPQEVQDEINAAIKDHVTTSRHHPAYFANDLIPELEAVKQMHDLDICEEVADWLAMAEEKGTNVYDWVKSVIGTKWNYTEDQVKLIYELLAVLNLYNDKYKEL